MWFALGSATLVSLCGAAVWEDVRERRIPNGVAVGALLAGIALRVPLGLGAVGSGLGAAAAAFGLGFAFYLLGGLGAGDVKLMTGLASFVGLEGLLTGFLVMAATGGVMAVVAMVRQRRTGEVFGSLGVILMTLGRGSFRGWKGESPGASLAEAGAGTVSNPYGVAIAMGAMAGWFLPFFGWTV